ncbi:MAG: transcriptional regulator [Melioribacteraceae bacterium]
MNVTTEHYIRQIEILARLKNSESFSKADLAFEYSVSEITINRDLKALRNMGFQVFSKNGTVKLLEQPLTEDLIHLSSDFLSLEISSNQLNKSISNLSKLKKENFFETLILLTKAVNESKIIEFTYKRFYDNEIKMYKLKPIKLTQNDFNWLIDGIKVGEKITKTFYLSKIENIKLTNKVFKKLNDETPNSKRYKIILKFNPEVKNEISDKIWFDNFGLQEDQTGFITLTTNQPLTNKLASWCISWWDTITIEEPIELKSYINKMIDCYRKNNL